MATNVDFVVVGSGGGGGTIAWLLAKAGFSVTLLEQGADLTARYADDPLPDGEFDPKKHDEYLFRLGRPDPKRRRRGDYCTFRPTEGISQPNLSSMAGRDRFWVADPYYGERGPSELFQLTSCCKRILQRPNNCLI